MVQGDLFCRVAHSNSAALNSLGDQLLPPQA